MIILKEKNNNIFVVIIVILSILLIISIGYTIYDKIESSKTQDEEIIAKMRQDVVFLLNISHAMLGEPIKQINKTMQAILPMIKNVSADAEAEVRTSAVIRNVLVIFLIRAPVWFACWSVCMKHNEILCP